MRRLLIDFELGHPPGCRSCHDTGGPQGSQWCIVVVERTPWRCAIEYTVRTEKYGGFRCPIMRHACVEREHGQAVTRQRLTAACRATTQRHVMFTQRTWGLSASLSHIGSLSRMAHGLLARRSAERVTIGTGPDSRRGYCDWRNIPRE